MTSGLAEFFSSAQAVSRLPQERVQRKWRLPSRPQLSFVAFIAAAVVLLGFPSLPTSGADEPSSVSPACTASGLETTCTCSETKAKAGVSNESATLSKDTNILRVECTNPTVFAPTEANGTTVCSAEPPPDFKDCKENIQQLLGGDPSSVKWEACKEEKAKGAEKCKTLTVPQTNLPFVDQRFAVGCTEEPNNNNKLCRIPVTIKARASATNGQTVTCAYGAGSNESRQAVTLNPSKNSFTLVCGEKGTVLPTNYDTKFCPSDPAGTSTTCDGDYQSILPGFENGWWKKDDPDTPKSFTLSIPVDKFPKEQAKMVVACQQTKTKSGSGSPAEGAATSSVCTVDVTIEASAFAAAARGMKWAFASLAGTALLVMVSQA
ncbi:SAG-related sequence [Besnoitia besnoiti]|uniref:SAG-related sequence n=1 Tax=Besnoitia besnoiti TaxID=94643 RepID=A0A2A9MC84_BESBE|nr:SAG-related sequence [Besnoitia besnoiti]PFH36098.1 SAG-related sequence [Besnoitia besnoiti]